MPGDFVTDLPYEVWSASHDRLVDDLVGEAPALGIPLLAATISRQYVDLNRSSTEMDSALLTGVWPCGSAETYNTRAGRGVIPRLTFVGKHALNRHPLSVTAAFKRLQEIWYPYHEELSRLAEQVQAVAGQVIVLDFHSMAPQWPGRPEMTAPDICLGDAHGTSCSAALRDKVRDAFCQLGYGVELNRPFPGGYITRHYGRPASGRESLQIEISKALYLDAKGEKSPNYSAFKRDVTQVLRGLATALNPAL